MKSYENTINKFTRSLPIKLNFSLVYKLKRIKSFFTGLRNVQISNERRVYICVFRKKQTRFFPPVVFSNLTYIRILIGIFMQKAHISNMKKYTKDTLSEYTREKKIPPATLLKFYVKFRLHIFFLLLCFTLALALLFSF